MAEAYTFDVRQKKNSIDIVLSSTMELIDRADELVKNEMEERGLQHLVFTIRMGMREGLTNSVRHGHEYDSTKLIHFHILFEKDKITIVVKDSGKGFDWRSIPEVYCENRTGTLKDHGRGLLIMKDYFDTLNFNEKGNILTLVKYLSA